MPLEKKWSFNKQINLSVVLELMFLASLIIGTWVNIQRRLCVMANDIQRILKTQQEFREKMEKVNNMCIGYEYRLRAVEKKGKKEFYNRL